MIFVRRTDNTSIIPFHVCTTYKVGLVTISYLQCITSRRVVVCYKDFSENVHRKLTCYIGPRVYPMESGNRPCQSVRPSVSPSLNISEITHQFLLFFCIKLEHHMGTQVTEPDFRKKLLGFTNGVNLHFRAYYVFFSISLHPVKIF